MNSVRCLSYWMIAAFVLSSFNLSAEKVRVYYDVGPVVYEVVKFDKSLPVLDKAAENGNLRKQFEGKWSYSGELPVNPNYMSPVYPYRVRKEPVVYSNRSMPDAYYVHLHSGFKDSLGWEMDGKENNLTIFGWLVDGEITNVMVTTPRAYARFIAHVKMDGKGIELGGKLVAWMLDEEGELVAIDRTNEHPNDRFFAAAMNGDLDTISKMMSENKKFVNVEDKEGRTPLMYAALGGRVSVSEQLIDNGAKTFVEDRAKLTPIGIAAESGWTDIVRQIAIDKPKSSKLKLQYSVALVNAYNARHQDISIHLLELGSKVDLDKKTAPKKVIGLFANECVELARWVMSEYKVDGSFSSDGVNYLHACAPYADTPLLESLHSAGASLTEVSKDDTTPLHIACGTGNREAICWFMENGGRPDEANSNDPILYAIKQRVQESVSCLIDYGVNVNKEHQEGMSALMFACVLGERAIAEILLDAGAVWTFDGKFSDYCLNHLIRLDSPKLLRGLVDQGLSLDYKLYERARLFDIADFYEAENILELLKSEFPGAESRLLQAKDLSSKPEIVRRTSIDYPFELQEKYGDVDVQLKLGISSEGPVCAVEVDEEVPKELRDRIESSLATWEFKPLDSEVEDSLVVVKFKLPLRMSIRPKDVFSLRDVNEMPRPIHQVDPNYPFELKMAGVSGFVRLGWVLDAQGVVRYPKAIESSDPAFEGPAIEAIKASIWQPAKLNGVPVAVRVTQRMEFNP